MIKNKVFRKVMVGVGSKGEESMQAGIDRISIHYEFQNLVLPN